MINALKTWWRGRQGESNVKAISKLLSPDKFIVLHDLMLPTEYKELKTSQIDHCVLSLETGLMFAIETKKLNGEVHGDIHDNNWTLMTPNGNTQSNNFLKQNYGHAKNIQKFLEKEGFNVPNIKMRSVVYLNEDKYKSKHNITNKNSGHKTANDNNILNIKSTDHLFSVENIVTTPDEYLNLIVTTVEKMKLALEQNPELKTTPMQVIQMATRLRESDMNNGIINRMIKNKEHIKNVRGYAANKKSKKPT